MKSEVRRGRKFVEYHDPETQDEFTFTQEISGADVSYQETDGSWHPADENWATDGVDGFVLKNDKLNHKIRLKGNGGRTWYPRRNVNTEYMTFGVPQYFDGKRWKNFRFSGWSVDGKTITLNTRQGVTILVHNRWNGFKIDWVLTSSSAPSRMRYPVSLTGITYVDGIIYGADGTRLGQLTPTTATDANGVELVCSGSFASGYVEFQADVAGASFPVTIDPDFSTTSTAGDNYLQSSIPVRNYGGLNNVNFTAITNKGLFRFDMSSVPSGAIVSASTLVLIKVNTPGSSGNNTLSFYSVSSANGDWVGGTSVSGNAAENESCWDAKAADGSAGVKTAWAGSAGMSTAGTDYVDTVLASLVNNRADAQFTEYTFTFNADGRTVIAGWAGAASNSGIVGITTGSYGGSQMGSSEHATESYRPKLTVTYTGTLRRTNMNAQMSNLTGGMHG